MAKKKDFLKEYNKKMRPIRSGGVALRERTRKGGVALRGRARKGYAVFKKVSKSWYK